jgi:glycosyltransferase involved in cell wall biosynthesis
MSQDSCEGCSRVTDTLSVVIPVYNEAPHIAETVDKLIAAVERSGFDSVDVVLVDDGSGDGSAAAAASALQSRLPLTVVEQPNRGRFHAVREGLRCTSGRYVLVLGARVRLRPDSLAFVRERLQHGEQVWTGHVHIHTDDNPYGTFMNVLTEIAWRDYFDHPRTVSFGLAEFDHFPKGSGCFVALREVLIDAFDAVPARYADVRYANDDAPMLRKIAAASGIHVSPSFAADYVPRASLRTFLRHSFHRGHVFLEGHGRRESRFFPYIVAFYPLSLALAFELVKRPRALPFALIATSAGAGTIARSARRSSGEVTAVAALAPLWAVTFSAGLWRGLGLMARARLARRGRHGSE